MVLPDPAAVPPIRLPLAPEATCTPPEPLARAAVPSERRPMVLPRSVFPLVPVPVSVTPNRELPEITFPAPAALPPIVLLVEPAETATPSALFARDTTPVTSDPM